LKGEIYFETFVTGTHTNYRYPGRREDRTSISSCPVTENWRTTTQ